jgi:hypothetical protein
VLAAVFVLGICAVVGYLFFGKQLTGQGTGGEQVSANQVTNEFLMTQAAFTQTAVFLTQSAPTAIPTVTPTTAKATTTPTSSISQITPIGGKTGTPGTQAAGTTGTPGTPSGPVEITVTKGLSGAATTPAPGTGTALAGVTGTPGTPAPPPSGGGTIIPTSSIIEVTPLGGGPTPTKNVSGVGGSPTSSIVEIGGSGTPGGQGGGSGGGTPTGQGGPIQPSITATLPQGGLAEGVGLASAGLLAMLLVVVVIIVRKIRLQ